MHLALISSALADDTQPIEQNREQQTIDSEPEAAQENHLSTCRSGQEATIVLAACLIVAEDDKQTFAERSSAYSSAGYIKIENHEFDLAGDYFDRALMLDANSDIAYAGRSDVEFAKGIYDQAIADAKKAIELKPDGHPESYLILGTLADRDGNHEARIDYMNKAIALAPEYAEAYAGRGNGYLAENKYDLALFDFNKALALKPELSSALQQNFEIIYVERGGLEVKDGNYSAAIDDYTQALQRNPLNVRALNDRGDAYNMTGDFDKAIADFTKAIDSDPSYPQAYSNRGLSYFKTGNSDRALRDLNKAIELNDRSSTTYFLRGEIYQSRSNLAAALLDFQKALELKHAGDPGLPDLLQAH
jgi:tetratricopeptide (TPR) repeat protein